MGNTQPWTTTRGMERLLSRELSVSDLVQVLTDLDPSPWRTLIGFEPTCVEREVPFKVSRSNRRSIADLLLEDSAGNRAVVEVKVGHSFAEDQQKLYELNVPETTRLFLSALAIDADAIDANSDRWTFLPLTNTFEAWTRSSNTTAATLASEVRDTLPRWDTLVSGVFAEPDSPSAQPLSALTQKFLARLVSRRIAAALGERDINARAEVASGGGRAIVQAWANVPGEPKGYFMADVRWRESRNTGELRFGIDFEVPDDRDTRRAAYALAQRLDLVLTADKLFAYLENAHPHLMGLLTRNKRDRPAGHALWTEVVELGFKSADNPGGVDGSRTTIQPAFYGDRTLRYQAIVNVDFSTATGADVINLIEQVLAYLGAAESALTRQQT